MQLKQMWSTAKCSSGRSTWGGVGLSFDKTLNTGNSDNSFLGGDCLLVTTSS